MTTILEGGLWSPKFYSQLPMHRNNGLEFVLLDRGSALWQVEGEDVAVEAGELFYTFPWQEHGSAVAIDHAIQAWWLVIPLCCQDGRWSFADQRLADLHLDAVLDGTRPRHGQRPFVPTIALRSYLELVVKAQCAANAHWQTGHLLPLLLAEWLQALPGPRPRATPGRSASKAVTAAWRYICQHHDQAWTLESMAAQAQLGRSQFSEGVIALTGASPMKALNRERLAAAGADLLRTNDTIADIAIRHGFNSAPYFSRQFRHYTHQSPSEFRERGGSTAMGWGSGDNQWQSPAQ